MIVLIGSQKGGCGKSTTAINVCARLAQMKKDVVLLDADRQSTAANWSQDRDENKELGKVHCIQKYESIRDTLMDLQRRYEYVIVDAAGRDSRELRTGMLAAHKLIIPLRPSQPDLDTLPKMQEIIIQAKDLNPELQILGLITMASTNPQVNEVDEAIIFLEDYPEIKLMQTVIRDRKIYRDSISEGKGVVETRNQKAIIEVENLVKEIFNGD